MQASHYLPSGRAFRAPLGHPSAASEEVVAQGTYRLISCHHYTRSVFSRSGSVRRLGTLNDESEDGDDEPQNYFAGGERRYVA